ncbi:sensor histidine kinase [Parafilimonas sp.]|uniref:sensor histidine kinase n=1 Tax=Parafilimonas sp. TaxID=1969739 RepID=UPI003F80ECC3
MKKQATGKKLGTLLMTCSIILVVAFQMYWIMRLYKEENNNLASRTDVLFKETLYRLQLQRFRTDTTFFPRNIGDNLFLMDVIDSTRRALADSVDFVGVSTRRKDGPIVSIRGSVKGEAGVQNVQFINIDDDSSLPAPLPGKPVHVIRHLAGNRALNDSLPVYQIDSAYKATLLKNNIKLPFTVLSFKNDTIKSTDSSRLQTSLSYVGLRQNRAYKAVFENPFSYIINNIKWQICFSFLLVLITVASFIFLYRNLENQRKLSTMKDDFVSNITHELKTPIATVTVAVEALKNFNAIADAARTQEYLEISSAELQRLSMLVDKVLRLSMLENKEIKLNKVWFNMYELTAEIIAAMKLQFEKAHAEVILHKKGEHFKIYADKVHISGLVYNLLDNALKYSKDAPHITVQLVSFETFVELSVNDKGIGISNEYKTKIFDKFFRVPSNAHHEAKGYGLGLSYVNHIVKLHEGIIEVESVQDQGSTFTVKLPYETPVNTALEKKNHEQ